MGIEDLLKVVESLLFLYISGLAIEFIQNQWQQIVVCCIAPIHFGGVELPISSRDLNLKYKYYSLNMSYCGIDEGNSDIN